MLFLHQRSYFAFVHFMFYNIDKLKVWIFVFLVASKELSEIVRRFGELDRLDQNIVRVITGYCMDKEIECQHNIKYVLYLPE